MPNNDCPSKNGAECRLREVPGAVVRNITESHSLVQGAIQESGPTNLLSHRPPPVRLLVRTANEGAHFLSRIWGMAAVTQSRPEITGLGEKVVLRDGIQRRVNGINLRQ